MHHTCLATLATVLMQIGPMRQACSRELCTCMMPQYWQSKAYIGQSAHPAEEGQEDGKGEAVHVVHGVQVTQDKKHGGPLCCQRAVHLTLLRESALHNDGKP